MPDKNPNIFRRTDEQTVMSERPANSQTDQSWAIGSLEMQ